MTRANIEITNFKDGDTLPKMYTNIKLECDIKSLPVEDALESFKVFFSDNNGEKIINTVTSIEKYNEETKIWEPVTDNLIGSNRIGKYKLSFSLDNIGDTFASAYMGVVLNNNTKPLYGRTINVSLRPKEMVVELNKPIDTLFTASTIKVLLDVETENIDLLDLKIEATAVANNDDPVYENITGTLINNSYVKLSKQVLQKGKSPAIQVKITATNNDITSSNTPNFKLYGISVLWA